MSASQPVNPLHTPLNADMTNEPAGIEPKVDSKSEAAKISIAKPAEESSTSVEEVDREELVTDKEKEEAINQAKAEQKRQWTLCLTFSRVCLLAAISVLLARIHWGETALVVVCRAVVMGGILGALLWAYGLEVQA
ncbi:hypothetical protein LTS10_005182 [Elasticomyces elasticus]|nr:hypothetical protein LTS10_005182 [Elasticomyces elasticus]